MNIVIPMAGLGQRFINAGFVLPKPLVMVGNNPMYQVAVNCLPLYLATKLIFIICETAFTQVIKKNIEKYYNDKVECQIIVLAQPTQGQAETVVKAANWLNNKTPTLVHNCDTKITTKIDWENLQKKNIDGALVLFSSNEIRWSYAKLNTANTAVIDVQEKKVISSFASTGTYYFADTAYLIHNINQMIKNNLKDNNEYYLSTVYRLMLQQKKKIIPLWSEKINCYGTPLDLVNSLNEMLTLTNLERI